MIQIRHRQTGQVLYRRGAKSLADSDLSGKVLMFADLAAADLRGADLRGADLSNADLRGARPDRGIRAVACASQALGLTVTRASPGGTIQPFCDPDNIRSQPQLSVLTSIEPTELMPSTRSRALLR